jgi:sugar phosphate permease
MQTKIRYQVLSAATVTAVILYLDRICVAEIAKLDTFREALSLSEQQTGAFLSAFFFAYALGQVPAGWLSDRFGTRTMLSGYIVIWSLGTMLTGLANSFGMLLLSRLLFGLAQAGCYPSAGSLIKRWFPWSQRGTASSIVSFGGRLGGAIAPILTAWLLRDYLSWRWVLTAYGVTGFFVAVYFWWVARTSPAEHEACNAEERGFINEGKIEEIEHVKPSFPPLLPLIKSGSMWLMCLLQFGINIGWVFLVTWLPTYLKEVKQVDPKIGGWMSTLVLVAGVVGMLLGGPLTDVTTRRLGRRLGRTLPMAVCYVFAIAAYLSCLSLESAWSFIVAAAAVAFFTDLSVPAIWAYMQDVGGENTAAVFGWGNMWGNLGAATTPLLVPIVLNRWDTNGDWHEAFFLFSAGYLAAMIAALGINAEKTIQS